MLARGTPATDSSGVWLPRGDACRPLVHCFESHGQKYAFFVRTSDLVQPSTAAYEALCLYDDGVDPQEIEAELRGRFGDEVGLQTMTELASLHEEGYLQPELELAAADLDADIAGLLRHQPRNLMFLVTEACNLACTYCYEVRQGVHQIAGRLDLERARAVVDAYLDGSPKREGWTITYFGGEPLLEFPLVRDTVLHAERRAAQLGKPVDFTMTTNLTLLTEEMAEFLAAHRFHVMVSLDGDREANDRYRKTIEGKGTYDTVVANLQVLIRKMREHRVRLPKLRATMTSENADPLAVERHLNSLGTPFVEVGETHGTVGRQSESFDFRVGDQASAAAKASMDGHVREVLDRLATDSESMPELAAMIVKSLRRLHEEIAREWAHQHDRPTLCGVCRNMKAVTPSGTLYPCHRYTGMQAFEMGNLHGGGLVAEKVRNYYEDLYRAYREKCHSCWARHLCGGQCPWYLSNDRGEILAPDEPTCAEIREGLEKQLGLYAQLLERFPEAFQKILSVDPTEVRGAPEWFRGRVESAPSSPGGEAKTERRCS